MNNIMMFSIIRGALDDLFRKDRQVLEWQNTDSTAFRLALYIQSRLDDRGASNLFIDMKYPFEIEGRTRHSDIVVHNRKGRTYLSLTVRNTYLNEEQKDMMVKLNSECGCPLVLNVSFLPKKDYLLIYNATSSEVSYYHYDINTGSCDLLKINNSDVEESEEYTQLNLFPKKRRRRKVQEKPVQTEENI